MVNSLEALELYSVPLAVLFDLLQAVWDCPLRKACVSALFGQSSTDELTQLSRTLPWDHPIARTLDHEVHRRKMAGKSCRFFFSWTRMGPFPHTHFFLVCSGVPRSRVLSASPLAHPPLPLPSTMSTELGSPFLVPICSCRFFS